MEKQKYLCEPCGYIYDPALGDPYGGISPGTPFEEIPKDWICPASGMGKEIFIPLFPEKEKIPEFQDLFSVDDPDRTRTDDLRRDRATL